MARKICFGVLLTLIGVIALLPLVTTPLFSDEFVPFWDRPFGLITALQVFCFYEEMLDVGSILYIVHHLVAAALLAGSVLGRYVNRKWAILVDVVVGMDLVLCLLSGLLLGAVLDVVLLVLANVVRKQPEVPVSFLTAMPSRI